MTDWVQHAVWWQVYPLGFTGAERSALPPDAPAVPRLRQLHDWLPYLVGLGCNGLALGPVFASETHGYDTVDHLEVDRRLGTEDDLVGLVQACHDRGVRVLLDGVFHHVGRGFPRFRDVLEQGPSSPSAAWFHLDPARGGPDGFGYRHFEGHRALVTLNHGNPDVADHVTRVLSYWCERGVDAWRLDAAYAVPPSFWREVLPRVRERHPHVWVVGEVIHGDYARYVERSGVDAVTQYELWKAIWSGLNDRNLFEVAHALERHAALLPSSLPQTFVGNHDVTRIASRLTDPRHLPLAHALLLALPGVPTVYYGDERGATGVKEDRAGGDDAVRPAWPQDPSQLPPSPLVALHQELIGVRRRHPWLAGATVQRPDLLRNELLAFRLTSGSQALGVVLNLRDDAADVRLALGQGQVVSGACAVVGAGEVETSVRVQPHGYALVSGAI